MPGIHATPAIHVTNLTRVFPGQPRAALQGISFSLRPGEWAIVAGPNEAGKSTLIRILATLIEPSYGRASVCGYDVARQVAEVRRCVGVVLDADRTFHFRLTGYQNLEFFGGLYGLWGRTLQHRVEEVLDQVGLTHARNVPFMKFSTGMRKRLAVARALLHDPPVYLLDEPLAHLDAGQTDRVLGLVRMMRERGKTILMTSHQVSMAGRWADRILWLYQGRLEKPAR